MSADARVKRLRPGDEIITYCGRCRQERTHQIVALNSEGQPDRVLCRFCQSDHLYRKNRSAAKRASEGGRAAQGPTGSYAQVPATPRPYSAKEVYAAGEVIMHPKFGQGRVTEARGGKIVVKFGSEARTLLHAG
jgi:hypothetical protein